MEEFLTKILLLNSDRATIPDDIALISCVLQQCYLLDPKIEEVRPSCVAFKNCFQWGGTIENSLASALLTLNSAHGPFATSYSLIETFFKIGVAECTRNATITIDNKKIIPGFGNPVIKSRDGRCEEIRKLIEKTTDKYTQFSMSIEAVLKYKKQKPILSNLAYWVAAAVHYLGLPATHASLLPILSFTICYVNRTNIWDSP